MDRRPADARRLVRWGMSCFWISVIVCYALIPTDWQKHGITHYGNHKRTIVPYGFGLLSSAFFMVLGAGTIPLDDPKLARYRRLMFAIAALLVGLLLTPPVIGRAVGFVHTLIGVALFICQIAMGFDIWTKASRNRIITACFLVQLVGSLVTILSLWRILPFMFSSQLLAQLGFALVLIVGTEQLTPDRVPSI